MRETTAREKGDRRTPDFGQAIMLLRNVYNEIIVSGILRLGWCLKSYLCYQFYSTKGPAARLPPACHLWTKIMSHACDSDAYRARIVLPFDGEDQRMQSLDKDSECWDSLWQRCRGDILESAGNCLSRWTENQGVIFVAARIGRTVLLFRLKGR